MFGGIFKMGCIGVLVSLCGIGFTLSSSIQQHVVNSYQQMTAKLEADTANLTEQTRRMINDTTDASVVKRITAQQREAANQYAVILLAFVFGVFLVSGLGVFIAARYALDRYYLHPIQARYDELKAEAEQLSKPNMQLFSNIPAAQWSGSQRPSCKLPKRYKVDTK